MSLFEIVLDIIFPPMCVICGKAGTHICDNCYQILKKYKMPDERIKRGVYSVYKYEDKVRDLLIEYKFNNKSYLYKFFSEIIIKNKKICKILKSCDIIIPVPLHRKRLLERGYNQSELVIKDVAKKLNLKIENKILKKTKNIKPQSEKGYKERLIDIKDAYIIEKNEKIIGKSIIVFDDVYTTGSTTNECKKVLLKAGAKKVIIVTMTKD